MKKILFALGVLCAATAKAQVPTQFSCETAYGVMVSMVQSQAPEEVIKYALNDMLGDELDDDEKHKIYLESMRWIHSLRGSHLLGNFDDKNDDEWIDLGQQVLCEGSLKVWPYE